MVLARLVLVLHQNHGVLVLVLGSPPPRALVPAAAAAIG